MKLIRRLLIALALLTTGSFALAAPGPGDHDRRGHDHGYDRRGHDDRRHGDWRRDYRRHDDRRYGYDHRDYRHAGPHYYPVRHHRWERGHRYYGPTYVVRDYGHYRLRPPPRGYHWVRADHDYLLVAIATGIILDYALR
ncbi:MULTISPECIES: RcnB family protein [Rhodanobacter]|uniref:RcnB family protein n=1 Tax=Rhodanobacter TaxID=75309 RepID=UPI000260F762|nr:MULTISPECIES: RcnB family protein [Rhodanobacter]EIL98988.1 putative transmembrane signal peptide protein [Rhodanobacter denitrificans]KZC20861.1 transmembrane signal peptide protein [Rhodanobacter denitrificans]UJJ51465.1 RcnB family protein [Rhodanobacter denitrificans]UJJ59753.1 RcnB family protein [Rhodanobacter denitrificans]UJM90667.1 RcnB family protein [Rhodanobacter denitrificans]